MNIQNCIQHGVFQGNTCPECGYEGNRIIHDSDRSTISKHLSWVLRHEPRKAGVALDQNGWASITDVLNSLHEKFHSDITAQQLYAVVAFDRKDRYEITDDKIRATYGHSVDVTIDPSSGEELPNTLYHGTITKNIDDIEAEGLKPMGRQKVYLAGNVELAKSFASRHGPQTIVFAVDVEEVEAAGYNIQHLGDNTYTIEEVPADLLSVEIKPDGCRPIQVHSG